MALGGLNGCGDFLWISKNELGGFSFTWPFPLVLSLKTGGDNSDAQVFFQRLIDAISPNDFGGLPSGILDEVGDFHDFIHEDFFCAKGDVEQDKIGSGDITVVEQRGFECFCHCNAGTAFTACFSGAHDGSPGIAHDRVHVVHVHVDFTGQRNDFGDAFGGSAQDFIGVVEGCANGQVAVQFAQFVIADDEQRVHRFAHFL